MLIYRCLFALVLPILLFQAALDAIRGRTTWTDLTARWRGPSLRGPVIWVHGASVGELTAARPVIKALQEQGPVPIPLRVLVTSNTVTGRATVAGWGLPNVYPALAPLDRSGEARRMMRQVKLLVIIENELWPNRMAAAAERNVPVALLSARISGRAARRWQMFPTLAAKVLSPVKLVVPQDAATAGRLASMGVAEKLITAPMVLKSAYAPLDRPLPAAIAALPRGSTVLAAATHPGEDEIVLEAFAGAVQTRPDLRLILAPRHPDRASAVARSIAIAGLTSTRRSAQEAPTALVYLADTMGEMDLWYRAAGVAFVGGSLVDLGGHTPFEPCAYDCPILHGPHVSNFAESYAALAAAGAAVCVRDADTLRDAILHHLDDRDMAARAREALPEADPRPVIARLKALLQMPDTVQHDG